MSGALRIDRAEDLHAFLLRGDEAVLLVGFVGMGADEFVAAGTRRRRKAPLPSPAAPASRLDWR